MITLKQSCLTGSSYFFEDDGWRPLKFSKPQLRAQEKRESIIEFRKKRISMYKYIFRIS